MTASSNPSRIGVDIGGTFTDLSWWTSHRRRPHRQGPDHPGGPDEAVEDGW